jgi:hypothetical protein
MRSGFLSSGSSYRGSQSTGNAFPGCLAVESIAPDVCLNVASSYRSSQGELIMRLRSAALYSSPVAFLLTFAWSCM